MNIMQNRKLTRAGLILLIVLALVLLVVFLTKKDTSNGTDSRYYDKYSGETISDIKGKTPETFGTDGISHPLYLGFGTLIDHGFTPTDVTNVQTAYETYFAAAKLKVTEVSMDVSSYSSQAATNPDQANNIASYTVVFNRKDKYRTELETPQLDHILLRLYDSSGKQVSTYDSEAAAVDDSEDYIE